jgi:hypothetical protein
VVELKLENCCFLNVIKWEQMLKSRERERERERESLSFVVACIIFVEQSSTIECYCQPPPQFGNDCKQASLFYETNKYFHTKKKEKGYHIA